jgi:Tol biopolymer transport system component
MKVERISDPNVHPGGKYVAFVGSAHDNKENKVSSTIKLIDLETGEERDLTPGDQKDSVPRWSLDGSKLAFVSDREGSSQIWILPFSEGGEAFRITEGDGGASQLTWSPDGTRIAFARTVIVSPHFDGNANDIPEKEKERIVRARTYGLVNERSSAMIEDSLLYRHWDHWRERKRSHLFIVDIERRTMTDITPGDKDVPPISLGGSQDFVFSPEGDEIAYLMNPDPVVAVSTNNSVFIRKMEGIEPKGDPIRISTNDAMDLEPRYSPDGRYISYLGAEIPTYEADRLRIKLYDRKSGETRSITEDLDRSPSEYFWKDDGFILFSSSGQRVYVPLRDRSGFQEGDPVYFGNLPEGPQRNR